MRNFEKTYAYYCVPLIATLILLTVIPITVNFYISLTSLNLLKPGSNQFIGFANFSKMLQDNYFWHAVKVMLIFIAIPVPLQIVFGLGLALLLRQKNKIIQASRAAYIPPLVIPPVVVGLIWKVMFIPKMGGLDHLASIFGLHFPDFLSSEVGALSAVIIATVWQWTPFVMLMIGAALEGMPQDPFEAAQIDGASSWQVFRYITLPMLRRILTIAVIFRVVGSLWVFPVVFSMTRGGPGIATEPVNYFAFRQAFSYYAFGYAGAIIVFLSLLILAVNLYFLKIAQMTFKGE